METGQGQGQKLGQNTADRMYAVSGKK